jgi:AraC-like DNA-binding protein
MIEPLIATVVLDETDIYREFAPPAALRAALACIWIRRGNGNVVRVLPDGCADIMWRSDQGAVVAGPDTAAWLSNPRPGELIVGARLVPGVGGAALGLPLSELRNQRVPLDELGLDRQVRVALEADPDEALSSLLGVTTALVKARPPDRAVQAAVARLLDPGQRVESLADDLGFSERQLLRRFQAAVGYGPKTLQRVLRLRRFLARVDNGGDDADLPRAAFAAGYADQPHLGRECRALTGMSPRQLISQTAPGSRATGRPSEL